MYLYMYRYMHMQIHIIRTYVCMHTYILYIYIHMPWSKHDVFSDAFAHLSAKAPIVDSYEAMTDPEWDKSPPRCRATTVSWGFHQWGIPIAG